MAVIFETDRYRGLPSTSYNYENGPHLFEDKPLEIPKDGINCQLAVHWFYNTVLRIELPRTMRSKEIFLDQQHFFDINSHQDPEDFLIGDVLFFKRESAQDPRFFHMTFVIGRCFTNGLLIAHANVVNGKTTIWTKDEFEKHERYEQLVRAKRHWKSVPVISKQTS